jgi:hypothetical protein
MRLDLNHDLTFSLKATVISIILYEYLGVVTGGPRPHIMIVRGSSEKGWFVLQRVTT